MPRPFRRFVSWKDRTRRDDASDTTGDGIDEPSLLLELRQQLSQVVAYREEHQRLLHSLDERLNQLDGLAQRVALMGLLQEGINVLILQHDLAQQGKQLQAAVAEAEGVERRLRAAEAVLLGQSGDPLITSDGAELTTPTRNSQNVHVVQDALASVDPAGGHRPLRHGLEHAPGFADD